MALRAALTLACSAFAVPPVATKAALPDAEAVCEAAFHQDAQVFGGNNVFVLPTGDVWVQTLSPAEGRVGYIDRRYHLTESLGLRDELSTLAKETEFFGEHSAKRVRAPDEPQTRITLRRCSGTPHTVVQFDLDSSARFKRVAGWFWELIHRATTQAPEYEGEPDFSWSPSRE